MTNLNVSALISLVGLAVISVVQSKHEADSPVSISAQRPLADDICRNNLDDPQAAAMNTKLCKLGLDAIRDRGWDEFDLKNGIASKSESKRGNVSPYYAMRYGKRSPNTRTSDQSSEALGGSSHQRVKRGANPYYAMRYGKRSDPYYVMRYGKRADPYYAMRYGKRADPYYAMRYGKRSDPYYAMRYGKRSDPYYAMRYGKRDAGNTLVDDASEQSNNGETHKRAANPYYAMRYGKRANEQNSKLSISSSSGTEVKRGADPYYMMRYG